ncbi:MAG: mechanosensitive ion channel family protein [Gammaproteobacteria bacterium]|nr:mechanosensitive ion channel family protein [Gammaproteobacteria bacterium]
MDKLLELAGWIHWETMIVSSMRILLILLIGWVGLTVVKIALRRMEALLVARARSEGEAAGEAAKRAETLARLIRQAAIILIWAMIILMILREIGIEIAPILASAGVVGLAVGFGAQNLVRDLITGFFMLLENQVRVGDVAIVNGTGGLVEQINLRTIVLRDLSGVVHVFPNGTINTLANVTREWSAYVFTVGVAYKEDTDHVVEVMRRVGAELKHDAIFGPLMIEDIEIFGVDEFADSAVNIKGRIKTVPIRQWDVGREYLRRVKMKFDQEGIEIPFPHRSIYFGEASRPVMAQLIDSHSAPTESASG